MQFFKTLTILLCTAQLVACGGGGSGSDLTLTPSTTMTVKTVAIDQLNLTNASAMNSLVNGNYWEFATTAVANLFKPALAANEADRTSVTLSTGNTCTALCAVIYKTTIPYVGNSDLIQPEAELPITSLSNIELNFEPEAGEAYLILIADKSKSKLSEQIVGTLSLSSAQKNLDAIPLSDIKSEMPLGAVTPSANLELSSEHDLATISAAMLTYSENDLIKKGNFDDTAKYFINIYLNSYAGDTAGKYVYSHAMAVANLNCSFVAGGFSDPAACVSVDNNVEFHLYKNNADLSALNGKTLSLYPPYDLDLFEGRGYVNGTPAAYGPNAPYTFTAAISSDGRNMIPVPLMTTDTNIEAGIWTVNDGTTELAAADFSFSMPFDRNGHAISLIPAVKIDRDSNGIAQKIYVKYMYFDGQRYVETEQWSDYIEAYRGAFIQLVFGDGNDSSKSYFIHHIAENPSNIAHRLSTLVNDIATSEVDYSFNTQGNQLVYDVSALNVKIDSLSFRIPFATQYMFEFTWPTP